MTTTIQRPTRSGPRERNGTLGVSPPPRRQRKWSLALVAVLVTLGSALAFVVLWMNAGERVPVLAMARTVPTGQVITSSDLTVVRVSSDPALSPVAAGRRGDVIGQTAATDLVAGSLLTESQLGEGSLLERGSSVVGVALKGGRLPTDQLRIGDRVLIVQTQPPSASASLAPATAATEGDDDEESAPAPPALGAVIAEGRVFGLGDRDPNTGSIVVSLIVPERLAATVAGAAGADLVSLVLVPAE